MKTTVIALAAATVSLAVAAPSFAAGADRIVNCRITSNGKIDFAGKCRFASGKGGTFTLQHIDSRKSLLPGIIGVTVYVMRRGGAEVRGLTEDGINSRWGDARRSGACWVGEDFKICAR